MFKANIDSLAKVSKLKVCLGCLVGDERGGVTGALFDIRNGGREEGTTFWRKEYGCDDMLASARDGLGKEEEVGLG